MAQQVQVSFVDDIDGSVADGTVSFVLDKTSFEIDLSEANATKLRDVFGPYIRVARKSGGSAGAIPRAGTRSAVSRGDTRAIREWAEAQGMTISARGRLSSEVKQAYAERDGAAAQEPAAVAPGPETPADESAATKSGRGKAPGVTFSGGE